MNTEAIPVPERPARFDKLPLYARDHIENLEALYRGALEAFQAAIEARGLDGGNTVVGMALLNRPQRPLGDNPHVEHRGPNGEHVCVDFKDGALEINGASGRVAIFPNSANDVTVRVERHPGEFS